MAYKEREKRLLHEWMWEFHRDVPQWENIALGPVRDSAQARLYKTRLRRADAIFIDPRELVLVEAKIKPDVGAVAQLELYESLVPDTPKFSEYKHLPIKKVILVAFEDRRVRKWVEDKGIKYEIYTPEWVREYWLKRTGQTIV